MFGRYALHNRLGDGGYSSVYKCTDALGVRFACKVLPKDKNKRARVQQEVRILRMLRESPKVVRFYEAGEDDSNFYIVQELCRGGAVRDYLANHTNYGENAVASIVRGALRGLTHMHALGVIHCDVKAGNVLLGDRSDDADVKLGDMGTAICADLDLVGVDAVVGTPWFMAPENLRKEYHASSDVWSVGVMTYQMLSGRMPFNDWDNPLSPSLTRIWRGILHEEPRMTGSRWEAVSEDAKDFVRACLVKSYKDRPSSRASLGHPWLTRTDCNDRFKGTALECKPFQYEDAAVMQATTIRLPHDLA
jgi:calcium-dependent protein kinase